MLKLIIMNKPPSVSFKIPPSENELSITHLKGSGPGGQNRNKRMSGVRVEHLPTGIVVVATERRSQQQNLSAALERLNEKLRRLVFRPKKRIKTKATISSQKKRLSFKKAHSLKKKLRGNSGDQVD
jgi:protein subunit release factor B